MRPARLLLIALGTLSLMVVTPACGDDGGGSNTGGTDAGGTDTGGGTPSMEERVAAECATQCEFEVVTCPDDSADAITDVGECEALCTDPNGGGLGWSAGVSEACFDDTVAFFECLQALTCEELDEFFVENAEEHCMAWESGSAACGTDG